jgi:ElaB/YqjD/DUF883 family membrane-anchored ribosome-binding protein
MSQNREGFNPNFPNTGTGSGSGSGSTAPGSTGPGSSSSGIGSSSYNSSTPGGTGSGTTGTATALSQTGHKISEAATQAKDYVSDKVSVVGDKLKELQNADIGEVAENAKEYARKNPGQAILISAAAGLVLGLILRGRRQ